MIVTVVDEVITCTFFNMRSVDQETKLITLNTLGQHVINLFVQYTPYKLRESSWHDPAVRVSPPPPPSCYC